jgi:hypothetical protein
MKIPRNSFLSVGLLQRVKPDVVVFSFLDFMLKSTICLFP